MDLPSVCGRMTYNRHVEDTPLDKTKQDSSWHLTHGPYFSKIYSWNRCKEDNLIIPIILVENEIRVFSLKSCRVLNGEGCDLALPMQPQNNDNL